MEKWQVFAPAQKKGCDKMANRRMFSLDVVDTDKFLDMPATSQNLYFHLGMRADDDGFVSSPKKITKLVNCGDDDLNVLISRGFIISMGEGIIVIRHWKQNNYIQSDRKKDTLYQDQLRMLTSDNGIYEMDTHCIQTVSKMEAQYSIGKNSIDKYSRERGKTFLPPTLEEVASYCKEKGYCIDADQFIDFYESKGWMIGKNKMKDWKAAVRTWAQREKNGKRQQGAKPTGFTNFKQRDYDFDELERQLLDSQRGAVE